MLDINQQQPLLERPSETHWSHCTPIAWIYRRHWKSAWLYHLKMKLLYSSSVTLNDFIVWVSWTLFLSFLNVCFVFSPSGDFVEFALISSFVRQKIFGAVKGRVFTEKCSNSLKVRNIIFSLVSHKWSNRWMANILTQSIVRNIVGSRRVYTSS